MQLLVDFFPILLFFIAYKWAGIYVATAVAIIISFIQIIYTYIRHRRMELLQVITVVLLVVLGGATLWSHNELFIKWKPTVINWVMGVIFLVSQWIGGKPFIQRLMQEQIELPNTVWTTLNMGWVIFFMVMGIINLYVVYHFDTNIWVNFKLFGMLGLTFIFVIAQAIYLSKHLKNE